MDLWQLHIFRTVVDEGSFSRAGRTVHLSQPTVSSHIKDLEDHFGCRLIDRLSREAVPTRAGELLYDYARRLLALRDEAETALAAFHGTIQGRLTVGGSTIPGGYLLPRVVGGFVKRHPGVRVALTLGDTGEMLSAIAAGMLELAVVGTRSRDRAIEQWPLTADEMRLVVRADHPWANRESVSPSELAAAPFILREAGSGTLTSFQHRLEAAGMGLEDLRVVAEMGGTGAVIQGIKSGVGVSVISVVAVAEELAAGTLAALAIEGMNLRRRFYLTSGRGRTLSPLAGAFVEFLRGTFPQAGEENHHPEAQGGQEDGEK
ncbi:MAG: selenium metabolism-associated LysR family transcriptional regulator [Thermodesulfobacteriota bacterium]